MNELYVSELAVKGTHLIMSPKTFISLKLCAHTLPFVHISTDTLPQNVPVEFIGGLSDEEWQKWRSRVKRVGSIWTST